MSGFGEILLGVGVFTGVVLALVVLILLAKSKLVASGDVSILINEQQTLTTPAGGKLLGCLASQGIFVSSACGGGGTCGQCVVKILDGGGEILPTERMHINRREAREGVRLSCQVAVKQDMKIEVPPEVFETDIVDRLSKVSFADADKARALARIGSKAARGICDKQGRITLTPELMAHAGLKEQVVLVGAIRTMQIMTPEAWEESHMSADEFLDQMQDIQERGEI